MASAVNAGLTKLYWEIGKRIHKEILKGDRADYGKQILATLSQALSQSYGSGFSYSALTRMVKFYESFQDEKIVAALSQQLSWSHCSELLPFKKPLQACFSGITFPLLDWRGNVVSPTHFAELSIV